MVRRAHRQPARRAGVERLSHELRGLRAATTDWAGWRPWCSAICGRSTTGRAARSSPRRRSEIGCAASAFAASRCSGGEWTAICSLPNDAQPHSAPPGASGRRTWWRCTSAGSPPEKNVPWPWRRTRRCGASSTRRGSWSSATGPCAGELERAHPDLIFCGMRTGDVACGALRVGRRLPVPERDGDVRERHARGDGERPGRPRVRLRGRSGPHRARTSPGCWCPEETPAASSTKPHVLARRPGRRVDMGRRARAHAVAFGWPRAWWTRSRALLDRHGHGARREAGMLDRGSGAVDGLSREWIDGTRVLVDCRRRLVADRAGRSCAGIGGARDSPDRGRAPDIARVLADTEAVARPVAVVPGAELLGRGILSR